MAVTVGTNEPGISPPALAPGPLSAMVNPAPADAHSFQGESDKVCFTIQVQNQSAHFEKTRFTNLTYFSIFDKNLLRTLANAVEILLSIRRKQTYRDFRKRNHNIDWAK